MPSIDQPIRVTHTVKTARHHFIDLRLPPGPREDAETVTVRLMPTTTNGPRDLTLALHDYQQLVNCLVDGLQKITGGRG